MGRELGGRVTASVDELAAGAHADTIAILDPFHSQPVNPSIPLDCLPTTSIASSEERRRTVARLAWPGQQPPSRVPFVQALTPEIFPRGVAENAATRARFRLFPFLVMIFAMVSWLQPNSAAILSSDSPFALRLRTFLRSMTVR